ncbi:MAG TPA: hypothetical protein VD767_02685 [Thermomicrobiales bacterium]|nr:hypothetical protein [Thermomicrobiales bacterium]
MDNTPIQQIGLRVSGAAGDQVWLDRLGWGGAPDTTFRKGTGAGEMWREAWVDGVDIWDQRWPVDFQLSQNHGTGLIAQGTEEWTDYTVSAMVRSPLAEAAGIAARIGGMRRYYALVLHKAGTVQLVKCVNQPEVLAEVPFAWEVDRDYELTLTVVDNQLRGVVDGVELIATDRGRILAGGSAGLIATNGTVVSGPVTVGPATR